MSRRPPRLLSLLCVALPLASAPAAEDKGGLFTLDGFRIPTENHPFRFPYDHGAHPDYKLEWWYLSGHLSCPAPKRTLGFQATFFRLANRPDPGPQHPDPYGDSHFFLAHMALSDVTGGRYFFEERLNRNGWDAWAKTGDLDLRNGNWSLSRRQSENGGDEFRLLGSVRAEARLELTLRAKKPPVIFGANGLSRKGPSPSACSLYITFPDLEAQGRVWLDDATTPLTVKGQAWMDHEISSSQLTRDQIGWNWACIQLKDQRQIMLYLMRKKAGGFDSFSTLTWISRDGQLTQFGLDRFSWTSTRRWRSPSTGANYPIDIQLKCPDPETGRDTLLRLRPLLDQQELVGHLGTVSYWEGACDVRNPEGETIGHAYLELTGYADDLSSKLSQ